MADETPPGVSLKDVLRAIFTSDDLVERRAAKSAAPAPAHKPDAVASPASESQAGPALAAGQRLALVSGTVGALVLGFAAQRSLTVAQRPVLGVAMYALCAGLWLAMLLFTFGLPGDRWAWMPGRAGRSERSAAAPPSTWRQWVSSLEPARLYLAASGVSLCALTFMLTAQNRLTFAGLVTWLGSTGVWIAVLSGPHGPSRPSAVQRLRDWLRQPSLNVRLDVTGLLLLGVLLVAVFYRFHRFDAVPPEMTSDHVEKLLDAYDVQHGRFSVFFPRNGGREAIQMYLVALFASVLGTGTSFASLKLVTALEGLALIPVMVALGRELFDRETGLVAGLLLAMSWWHVSLSRMGLRIALTPLVTALVLIALLRAVRSGERRHFIATGIWLGVGAYSYQALRILPLVVVAGVALAMLARNQEAGARRRLLSGLLVAGLVALVIFVPMGRFWADSPEILWGRVVNRTTSSEVAIRGSPAGVFASNLRDALLMFNWRGDVAWISSLPGAPLLDVVSGFLFVLGVVAWGVRLAVRREPLDWLVPAAMLILLLPSALAIAFPIENPSATRASGVIPLAYLLAAWPLRLIWQRWSAAMGSSGRRLALAVIGMLGLSAALFNYDAYFHRYWDSYRLSALNPGEVGESLAGFAATGGSLDNAYLQGYPFWHDYRAIGIEAGDITWNNAILDTDNLTALLTESSLLSDDSQKLFIVHPDDEAARTILQEAYPQGQAILRHGSAPNHDYTLFIVPAGQSPEDTDISPSP